MPSILITGPGQCLQFSSYRHSPIQKCAKQIKSFENFTSWGSNLGKKTIIFSGLTILQPAVSARRRQDNYLKQLLHLHSVNLHFSTFVSRELSEWQYSSPITFSSPTKIVFTFPETLERWSHLSGFYIDVGYWRPPVRSFSDNEYPYGEIYRPVTRLEDTERICWYKWCLGDLLRYIWNPVWPLFLGISSKNWQLRI